MANASVSGCKTIVVLLIYITLSTLPDISFAVAAHCNINFHPFVSNLSASEIPLQYLQFTADIGLHFSCHSIYSNNQLHGNTNSDSANDTASRKSLGRHVFFHSNGSVSWQPQNVTFVAMLTFNAIYITCSNESFKATWLPQHHYNTHSKDVFALWMNCNNYAVPSHSATGITMACISYINVCYHHC